MSSYFHQQIESKWQKHWKEKEVFSTNLKDKSKPKKYILAMFPYPSGEGLHVGHVRCYTIADAMARYYRMQGYNVLLPIGWDAFGLPAEQYAIQTGNHPDTFTAKNIQRFKEQLFKLGFSFDWSKEINTSEPSYYHWTQWIFKQIYLSRLAEYKEIPVFWCEKLGTVLANEEVKTVNGKKVSERGFYPVVQRFIPQWVLKITDYAWELLEGLEKLDWPTSIKSLQRNWIGLSQGTFIDFPVINEDLTIKVFTKSPQTIYGVTTIALATNHPLISQVVSPDKQVVISEFCDYWKEIERKEILGEFTGGYCQHPLTGEKLPIWVTNFVLGEYGTGAVMINAFCPEIFEYKEIPNLVREKELKQNKQVDYNFVQKYNLPIKKIFAIREEEKNVSGFLINSPLINDLANQEKASEVINNYLEKAKKGQRGEFYHLKDWIFSRQRYWGEPIPIIHWENGQKEILADQHLPLKLPPLANFTPSPLYYSPLQKVSDWVNVIREDKLIGKRDINVMPQWAGSSWYYIAYLLRNKDIYLPLSEEVSKEIINYWLPVDLYIGGQEHANLHLLYARFWHKVLKKKAIINYPEPFQKLLCQGMILGNDGEKMSKSRGNVINPDQLIEECGADALRLYIIFVAPPEQTTDFQKEGVRGMRKWLGRVYNLFTLHKEKFTKDINNVSRKLREDYEKMITKSTGYYESLKLNLIPPLLMTFINQCYQADSIPLVYGEHFLQILNPLAPHLTEEIANHYYYTSSLIYQTWPKIRASSAIASKKINVLIMINGKKRAVIATFPDQDEKVLLKEAQNEINKYLIGKKINKTIVIKNKLINFVLI